MTALADTNIFIRHLTGDPPEQAERATAYLTTADLVVLPDLILAEIVYVLESFYRIPRNRVAQAARSLIAFNNVKVADLSLLLHTIEIYEIHRSDFADAYIAAYAETSGIKDIATFDKSISRVTTINRIEP